MSGEDSLPPEAVEALRSGRKLEAIKLLRKRRGVGLREAKEAVEAYARSDPHLEAKRGTVSASGVGRLLLLAVAIGLAYLAYRSLG